MKLAGALVLVACIATAIARPDGAPLDACIALRPAGPHGPTARPPGAPYNIDLSDFFSCPDVVLQPTPTPMLEMTSSPVLEMTSSLLLDATPSVSQPLPTTSLGVTPSVLPTVTPTVATTAPPTDPPVLPTDPVTGEIIFYYVPGLTYRLILRGNDNATLFRGFLVQARLVADGVTRVGQFVTPPEDGDVKLSNCVPATDGVTHTINTDKNYVMFSWTAPPRGTGDIRFHYTIVRVLQRWWVNEMTAVIRELPIPPQPDLPDDQENGAPSVSGLGFGAVLAMSVSVAMKTLL